MGGQREGRPGDKRIKKRLEETSQGLKQTACNGKNRKTKGPGACRVRGEVSATKEKYKKRETQKPVREHGEVNRKIRN